METSENTRNRNPPVWVAAICCTVFVPLEFRTEVILRPFDFLIVVSALFVAWRDRAFVNYLAVVARLSCLFLLAYAWRAVDGVVRGNYVAGIKELIQAGEFLLCGIVIASCSSSSARRLYFLKALLVGCALIAIGAMLLTVGGGPIAGLKLLDEPKYTYGLATLLLTAALVYRAFQRSALKAVLALGLLVLLVLSGERSAWLGLCVALPTALLLSSPRMGVVLVKGAVVSACLIGVIMLTAVAVGSKNEYVKRQIERTLEPLDLVDLGQGRINYLEAESPSNRSRLFQLDTTLQLIREYPLTGIGTGSYRDWAYWQGAADFSQVDGVHGQTLALAAENGLPPALMYLGCWAFLFVELRRQVIRRVNQPSAPSIVLSLALAIYCFVVVNVIGTSAAGILMLFIPIGLTSGMIIESEACLHEDNVSSTSRIPGTRSPSAVRVPLRSARRMTR